MSDDSPSPLGGERWASAIHAAPSDRQPPPRVFFLNLWRELIWPARRIWAGFAAVWLAIVGIHLAEPGAATAKAASPGESAATFLASKEQEKIIAELTEPTPPSRSEPPQPGELKPRSERQAACCIG